VQRIKMRAPAGLFIWNKEEVCALSVMSLWDFSPKKGIIEIDKLLFPF
jgi:hypothetical protein